MPPARKPPSDLLLSSRRRHTRLQGDWSSDVCSSDDNRLGRLLHAQPRNKTVEQQIIAPDERQSANARWTLDFLKCLTVRAESRMNTLTSLTDRKERQCHRRDQYREDHPVQKRKPQGGWRQ